MNIIVMTKNETLKKALIHKLMPDGINLVNMNTIEEVAASIPIRSRIAIIDDEDVKDIKEILKKVREIKINKNKATARLILVTKINDSFVLKSLFNIGFDLVLQNSLHIETIVDKIYNFIFIIIKDENSNRRYIRVKPDKNEDTTIRILLNNNQYANGKITDISLGGVAAEFSDEIIKEFKEKDSYKSVQIILGERNIVSDIMVVKTGGKIAAFLFLNMRDSFKTILSEYIFEKIQQNLDILQ